MKLKIYKTGFENSSLNINNHTIKFYNGYAEVSDNLGAELIQDHPNLFKAPEVKVEKKVDLSSKLQEIENLQQQLMRFEREVSRLKDLNHSLGEDLALWKDSYNKLLQEKQKEQIEVALEDMTLNQLKEEAKKLNVDTSVIKRKTRKDDWIEAIKDHKE